MSKLCDFLEAELENRQSAGGDETDYVNEAREALAELAALRAERDELREELSIWKSVFPDIAPESVQPDRSKLEADLASLRALLVRAGEAAQAIHMNLAPGNRTFDELIRDAMLADDMARVILALIPKGPTND